VGEVGVEVAVEEEEASAYVLVCVTVWRAGVRSLR